MSKVAFIGLGVMGYPMAGHLSKHYDTIVYNRTTEKSKKWIGSYNGKMELSITNTVKEADFVFCCVGNDNDLKSVLLGQEGAINSMKKGAILVDHTTCSAKVSKEIAVIANNSKIKFIDAPVSGGQIGAENGQLTIMCGGDEETYYKIESIISCYSKYSSLMGPIGSGQLTKMVNQICIAGLVQGLAEGLNFSKKANLDGKKVLDVISKGAAGSWQMENRGETMLNDEFDFGFAVDWMRKDLNICLDEANNSKAKLPITALINQFYCDIQDMGGGRFDTSSLIKRL
ncbi:MAG: NAD(P)-dependent oxidoreductase [Paracoccaceae bacterium]